MFLHQLPDELELQVLGHLQQHEIHAYYSGIGYIRGIVNFIRPILPKRKIVRGKYNTLIIYNSKVCKHISRFQSISYWSFKRTFMVEFFHIRSMYDIYTFFCRRSGDWSIWNIPLAEHLDICIYDFFGFVPSHSMTITWVKNTTYGYLYNRACFNCLSHPVMYEDEYYNYENLYKTYKDKWETYQQSCLPLHLPFRDGVYTKSAFIADIKNATLEHFYCDQCIEPPLSMWEKVMRFLFYVIKTLLVFVLTCVIGYTYVLLTEILLSDNMEGNTKKDTKTEKMVRLILTGMIGIIGMGVHLLHGTFGKCHCRRY